MSEDRDEHVRGGGSSNPSSGNYIPGLPTNFNPVVFQGFTGGVNTLVSRAAIKDDQLAWCDSFVPLGPDCLRAIPDVGVVFYTAPAGLSIIDYGFGNILNVFYVVVLLSDGSVVAAEIDPPNTVFPVLPAGTINNVGLLLSGIGVSQWGSKYIVIVAPQNNGNGYWLWDGGLTYGAGTVGPEVTITDGSIGYDAGLSIVIGIPQSNGSVTAVATAGYTLDASGSVAAINIATLTNTNIAEGTVIIVAFQPDAGKSTAFGGCTVASGVITSANLTNGGSGYTTVPTVTVTDPTGTGAVIVVNSASGGIITGLKVVSGGANYTSPVVSFSGGGGSGATATVTTGDGVIIAATPWNLGSGYLGNPTVNFLSPTGSGASATPIIAGGQVVGLNISAGGSNYSTTTNVIYTLTNGNGPASATVTLMPFDISGTEVETYKDRVWVCNGRSYIPFIPNTNQPTPVPGRVIFSSPGTPVDFNPATGGGAFLATDSFTRVGYMRLIQSNGFLYLIGDSSINYISGVQTTSAGTPPVVVTQFANVNADPELGSVWPASVQKMSRNIMLANTNGIYIAVGGAVQKVSEALDGVYHTNDNIVNTNRNFPAAVATIFGREVYCLLLPVLNPVTGITGNYLLMFDGHRCFTANQSMNLIFIKSLSRYGRNVAYGTDGTNIAPLFIIPSTNLTKTIRSKLYANPAYWTTKTANELHGVCAVHDVNIPLVQVTLDNETAIGAGNALVNLSLVPTGTFVNANGQPIQFINGSTAPVSFGMQGISVFGPVPIGQAGRLVGLTLTTTATDLEVNSMTIQERIETMNV